MASINGNAHVIDMSGVVPSESQQRLIDQAKPLREKAQISQRCCNYLSTVAIGAGALLAVNILRAVHETYQSQNPVLAPMLKAGSVLLGVGAISGALALYFYHRNYKCQHELSKLNFWLSKSENKSQTDSVASPSSPVASTSITTRRFSSNGRPELQI